jgi:hypothetical protein
MDRWHGLYFCLAQGCDTPILEALWVASPSLTSRRVFSGLPYVEHLLPLLADKLT